MGQNSHSGHWGINSPSKTPPPLSCQAPPPLNQKTVQAPPFLGNLLYILVFQDSPLKVGSFSKPPKY